MVALRDLTFFNRVRLDPEAGTLVWPNEADFDPATLHDWDEVAADMIRMVQSWPESIVFVKVVGWWAAVNVHAASAPTHVLPARNRPCPTSP